MYSTCDIWFIASCINRRVGFEFRQGGAEIVQLNAVRFKPKLVRAEHWSCCIQVPRLALHICVWLTIGMCIHVTWLALLVRTWS